MSDLKHDKDEKEGANRLNHHGCREEAPNRARGGGIRGRPCAPDETGDKEGAGAGGELCGNVASGLVDGHGLGALEF